jgi:hypothetical protein
LALGCGGPTAPPDSPEAPREPASVETAPAPSAVASGNPCDQLSPHAFDVDDIDARSDLTEAQKEQLRLERDARRKVLFECFNRAMQEQ